LINKIIPEGGNVIKSLEVRVHVAGVSLIDKARIISAWILFDFDVIVDKQVREGFFDFESYNLYEFKSVQLFPVALDVPVLNFVPRHVNVFSPNVKHAYQLFAHLIQRNQFSHLLVLLHFHFLAHRWQLYVLVHFLYAECDPHL
jgi:hypothetical protein